MCTLIIPPILLLSSRSFVEETSIKAPVVETTFASSFASFDANISAPVAADKFWYFASPEIFIFAPAAAVARCSEHDLRRTLLRLRYVGCSDGVCWAYREPTGMDETLESWL